MENSSQNKQGPPGPVTLSFRGTVIRSPVDGAGPGKSTTAPQTLRTISCPTASVCYAGGDGGVLLGTRDAGRTWERQAQSSLGALRGTTFGPLTISCPAVRVCYTPLGGNCNTSQPSSVLLGTSDGGRTWTRKPSPPACLGPAFACPSVTTCYDVRPFPAPQGVVLRTTNGAKSWDVRSSWQYRGGRGAVSLVCPSSAVRPCATRVRCSETRPTTPISSP